jgi:hypothetical protein
MAELKLGNYINDCRNIGTVMIAVFARRFPVFLVPNPEVGLPHLSDIQEVRVSWDQNGWYLRSAQDSKIFFSFDLPPDLFELYANQGFLTADRALDLKADVLSDFQAVSFIDGRIRVITFGLDMEWLARVRSQLKEVPRVRETEFSE